MKGKWPHPTGDYSGAEIAKRAENRRAIQKADNPRVHFLDNY
jgi:hypothetical protein